MADGGRFDVFNNREIPNIGPATGIPSNVSDRNNPHLTQDEQSAELALERYNDWSRNGGRKEVPGRGRRQLLFFQEEQAKSIIRDLAISAESAKGDPQQYLDQLKDFILDFWESKPTLSTRNFLFRAVDDLAHQLAPRHSARVIDPIGVYEFIRDIVQAITVSHLPKMSGLSGEQVGIQAMNKGMNGAVKQVSDDATKAKIEASMNEFAQVLSRRVMETHADAVGRNTKPIVDRAAYEVGDYVHDKIDSNGKVDGIDVSTVRGWMEVSNKVFEQAGHYQFELPKLQKEMQAKYSDSDLGAAAAASAILNGGKDKQFREEMADKSGINGKDKYTDRNRAAKTNQERIVEQRKAEEAKKAQEEAAAKALIPFTVASTAYIIDEPQGQAPRLRMSHGQPIVNVNVMPQDAKPGTKPITMQMPERDAHILTYMPIGGGSARLIEGFQKAFDKQMHGKDFAHEYERVAKVISDQFKKQKVTQLATSQNGHAITRT